MKNVLVMTVLAMLSTKVYAADEVKGETLVRSLSVGEYSMVLFQNPTGESARTMVFCLPSEESAKGILSNPKMGGIMLLPGSKIILKKDTSTSFADGSNLQGTYIQIECK